MESSKSAQVTYPELQFPTADSPSSSVRQYAPPNTPNTARPRAKLAALERAEPEPSQLAKMANDLHKAADALSHVNNSGRRCPVEKHSAPEPAPGQHAADAVRHNEGEHSRAWSARYIQPQLPTQPTLLTNRHWAAIAAWVDEIAAYNRKHMTNSSRTMRQSYRPSAPKVTQVVQKPPQILRRATTLDDEVRTTPPTTSKSGYLLQPAVRDRSRQCRVKSTENQSKCPVRGTVRSRALSVTSIDSDKENLVPRNPFMSQFSDAPTSAPSSVSSRRRLTRAVRRECSPSPQPPSSRTPMLSSPPKRPVWSTVLPIRLLKREPMRHTTIPATTTDTVISAALDESDTACTASEASMAISGSVSDTSTEHDEDAVLVSPNVQVYRKRHRPRAPRCRSYMDSDIFPDTPTKTKAETRQHG